MGILGSLTKEELNNLEIFILLKWLEYVVNDVLQNSHHLLQLLCKPNQEGK